MNVRYRAVLSLLGLQEIKRQTNNMNYELAKKLKDMGFKQEDFGVGERHYHKQGDVCYEPTLSELIEACGEEHPRFSEPFFLEFAYKGRWEAGYSSGGNDRLIVLEASGSTPEEAVARLWIELNK